MARTQVNPVADQAELLPVEIPPAARHPKVRMITRSEIFPDPEQPRQQADAELRDSLARNGMLQPITVRRHPSMVAGWMIVDGERRWRSAEGVLNDLPCIVREDMEELPRRLATQLEANTGKSLTPLEEARAFGKLLEETGSSVADLAKLLGRAPSTIAERVALLELGPWLPLIESGEVVMSHAVKVLLPLRTVPDDVHAHAIELLRKDYRFAKKGTGAGISLGDFENLIRQFYTPSMYPLAKTKVSYHKQPAFNTAKHDAECGCGGIKFDIGSGIRLCCGNPSWWRPLDRAAKKAKKAAEPKAAEPKAATEASKRLYLPAGTPWVKSDFGSAPKGVVQLTDRAGRWYVDVRAPFDPADLVIDDAKLVQWANYRGDFNTVGTKDLKAVEAARAKWAERFAGPAAEARAELRKFIEHQKVGYHIDGLGTRELASRVIRTGWGPAMRAVIDVAQALELPGAEALTDLNTHELAEWAQTQLSAPQAAQLLTGIVVVEVQRAESKLPSVVVDELERKARAEIEKRRVPWRTKPKAEKKAATTKKSAPAPRTPAAAFMKPMYPSAALAAVVGGKAKPRTEVTKALWKYIKKHGLQDRENRRMINADEKLRVLFGGKDAVSLFDLTKIVNKHVAGTAEAAALIYTSEKKAKGKKAASKLPLSKLSTETAELPLADDPLATFRDEEAELTLADERAAAGAFDEDEEDEAPGVGAGWDDDSDDLWDDAGDELEEAEA